MAAWSGYTSKMRRLSRGVAERDRATLPNDAIDPVPSGTDGLHGWEKWGRTGAMREPRGPDGEPSVMQRHVTVTPAEALDRRATLYGLLNVGADAEQVRAAMMRRHGMTAASVDHLVREARRERAAQFEEDRGRYKSEQVQRLQADLVRMRSQERKPWAAIARHEGLLASIVGTREPVGVRVTGRVDVTDSLAAVIQAMDADAVDDVVREQVELVALARQARLLQAAPPRPPRPQVIDAVAEPTAN